MTNYQKRLKKVSLFIRYNLLTEEQVKTYKNLKNISYCYIAPYQKELTHWKSLYETGSEFSQTEVLLLIAWLTIKHSLKKVLVRVSYTNWLLRTTTDTHKKYSSYLLLLIRTQAGHFVFRSPSSVRRNRKVTHVQYNHSGLDWFAFPCTILSRCHTQDCSRKEERLLLACKLLQKMLFNNLLFYISEMSDAVIRGIYSQWQNLEVFLLHYK